MIKQSKNIVILFCCAFIVIRVSAQTDKVAGKIQWYSFEDAVKMNVQNHKKVFIDIFTDWCGWCKELDRSTFTNPAIVKLMSENFIAVKLNAERKDTVIFNGYMFVNPNPNGNRSPHQLASSMLKGRMMYPSMVFMDDSMRIITTVQSYLKPVDLEPILAYVSSNKYLNMKFDSFKLSYIPLSIETEKPLILREAATKPGVSSLEKSSQNQLDSMVMIMKINSAIKIEIDGYTDNTGDEATNKTISENWAKAIYDYFISGAIDASRLTYSGFGPINPIGDNSSAEGQKLNRRVEIKILSK
jgi:thioredoxin-related protein